MVQEPANGSTTTLSGGQGALTKNSAKSSGMTAELRVRWTLVLVVGLAHGDHVAGIGAVVTVGTRTIVAWVASRSPACCETRAVAAHARRALRDSYRREVLDEGWLDPIRGQGGDG